MVGTGALTLPAAFAGAGWLISLIVILFLAFVRLYINYHNYQYGWSNLFWTFSFITLTFVVETMGVANAILRKKRMQRADKKDTDLTDQDDGRDCDINSDMSSPSSPSRGLVRYSWFSQNHFLFSTF